MLFFVFLLITGLYQVIVDSKYFIIVTQFDFGTYGSKELLIFLTIFVYSDNFKKNTSLFISA
ncbi:MAG: hypothetical protein AB7U51_11785 [Arcobacter sp.]|uniref:hypothetical protein n=1 Tax=Arcobacter sp. TaxID=1872629 RepID=UPI003CFC15C6